MQPDATIYVAGHTGMVGSAIYRALVRSNHPVDKIYTRSRAELNLLDQGKVLEFFDQARPNVVIISAAKVGGIRANSTLPYDFLSENVLIQANLISACKIFGVSQICFLGSSCMYPPSAKQPFVEDALFTASFEPTNEAYALLGSNYVNTYRLSIAFHPLA